MKVHILKPYALDKNLGRAYNEACALIPEGDWICLMDYDTMFLTPDCGRLLDASARFADARHEGKVLFTCYTNRISPVSARDQLYGGELSEEADIRYHIATAEELRQQPLTFTQLKKPISGFLLLFSKALWNEVKFDESMLCLGVDNAFSAEVLKRSYPIGRINSLYVFHVYRMQNGIKDKSHLL